jgi:hypothetical protein
MRTDGRTGRPDEAIAFFRNFAKAFEKYLQSSDAVENVR